MTYYHRHARFHDASLLRRYQLDPVTQIGLMIERNRHHDASRRPGDDICRVKPASQPNLDDGNISGMLGKQDEGCSGQYLENRDGFVSISVGHATQRFSEDSVINKLAAATLHADAVTFVPMNQMRRCVYMNA